MNQAIEFVMNNYIWILVIILLILLAIIGSYADKTNFGQGKKNIESDIPKMKLSDVVNSSKLNNNNDNIVKTNQNDFSYNKENNVVNNQAVNSNLNLSVNQNSANDINLKNNYNLQGSVDDNNSGIDKVPIMKSLEEKLNNLDFEIKSVLPEKETINTELLDDISDLSLDFDSKLNFGSNKSTSSSFDDLELPTIKSLKK